MTDEAKQAAMRLCGMTFDSHRKYCVYKSSSLYKRDWDAVRTMGRASTDIGEEPEDVRRSWRNVEFRRN